MSAMARARWLAAPALTGTAHNRRLSRRLIASAQRATRRGTDLVEAVHERRRRPDFFNHLAKYARVFPRMRRCLPLAGGADDLLHVEMEELPEGVVFRLSGEVDLANASGLQGTLDPVAGNCRNVVLDVSHLRYIDSTGLYVVVNTDKVLRQHNCRLVVCGASPMIAKIMRIFGLDGLVPMASSVDEAVDLLRSRATEAAAND